MGSVKVTFDMALAEGWLRLNENDGYCYCGCGNKTNVALVTRRSSGVFKGTHLRYVRGHSGDSAVVRAWIQTPP